MVRSSALPLFACSTSAEESIWIFEDGWLVQDPTSFCWDRGDGRTDGQTGRRHGQRFAILHAKEKNDIVLRCGPSPCLSRARLPSQTEAALPDVCSPTVRYGTVPIYPSQPFSGFRLCFRTRILKTFGSCITPTKICTCSRMKHGNQESL